MSDETAVLPEPLVPFPEVFARRVARAPDAVAFTEVTARGRILEDTTFTLGDVAAAAARAATCLRARGVAPGDRVVLCVERPDAFLAFLLGAHRIGAVPVPLPSLGDLDTPAAFRERVRAVCEDCTPSALVLEEPDRARRALDAPLDGAHVIDAAEPDARVPADDAPAHRATPDEIAFLQYTSGSTGRPKGVIVTHGNLTANFHAIVSGAGFGPGERSLSWLPLHHDMGLVGGFLLGLYAGFGVFVMRPRAFLFRPDAWLRAMTRARATFTVAPNFAYSLVAKRLPDSALADIDLSSLRLAFNGAEPIDRPTVDAFVARLAPHGFRPEAMYPVYGLAECTLAVAFPRPGDGARYETIDRDALYGAARSETVEDASRGLAVVSVGRAVPKHTVTILAVDRDAPLGEREVGEIAVAGPSVSPGYFGHPPREGAHLRTGDLGYLADGELRVVDRLKDLVIVRGRNYAPTDIERAIARVPGLTRGAIVAFAEASEDGTEGVVIVAALDPSSLRTIAQIKEDVRQVLLQVFTLVPRDVRVVAPGTIPKTTSGKVRRRACRDLYVAGELHEIDGLAARASAVAARLRTRVGVMIRERG